MAGSKCENGQVWIPLNFKYFFDKLKKSAWHVSSAEAREPPTGDDLCPVAESLRLEAPEYADDIMNMVSESQSHPQSIIKVGNSFDVNCLLSCHGFHIGGNGHLVRNNGELVELKEETYRGKYVLVCCFYVPVLREDHDSNYLQALVTTCSELHSMRGDFEMVMVAKMNNLANYKVVFDHFFSGFPTWCLAVPFEDSRRHDYICKYLDLGPDSFKCLLVDDKGVVLPFNPSYLKKFGAEAFPFTVKGGSPSLEGLLNCKFSWWNAPLKLEEILNCSPSDAAYKIYRARGGRKKVRISELSNKLVGLYLCSHGSLIRTLHKMHKQCKTRSLELEIVVVYLPFLDCLDPEVYQESIDRKLKRRKVSWWRFPFNNSVCRRLWRLTYCYHDDRMMIVGPGGRFVDLYGGDVMRTYGIDAYPFTREELVQREINKLRALTLESLLVYGSRDYVVRGNDNDRIPVKELQGWNIFLYFDSFVNIEIATDDYDNFVSWYHVIKAEVPDFEVVFVTLNAIDTEEAAAAEVEVDFAEKRCTMPWLICPFDPDHSALLKISTFRDEPHERVLGFGKDGRVCSFRHRLLVTHLGPDAFPLDDHLRDDVTEEFNDTHFSDFDM